MLQSPVSPVSVPRRFVNVTICPVSRMTPKVVLQVGGYEESWRVRDARWHHSSGGGP